MPNFWSTTMQKIYEAFNGPRTRDSEFDQKVTEVKQVIKAMTNTTNLIRNFPSRTSGIRSLCQELVNNLLIIYKDKGTIFSEFANDVISTHRNIEKAYLSCCEVLQNCQVLNSEWDKLFNEVKQNMTKREEARQVYDHYDEKMEKLVKERNEKLAKKEQEDIKDIEKFDRNDGKYKRAANDYINLSLYTYKLMQKLLDFRYKLINPMVATLVQEEKKFVDNCQKFFFKFENILVKINALGNGFIPTTIEYDPRKHIRATKLLNGVNVNNLPEVHSKQKYTFNDYLNKKGGNEGGNNYGRSNTSNINNNNYNNNNNNVGRSVSSQQANNVNPYSYAAYKQKTKNVQKTDFNNNNNNNNNIINNNSNFNKNSVATANFNMDNSNFNFDNTAPVNNYDFGFNSNDITNNPYNNINIQNNNSFANNTNNNTNFFDNNTNTTNFPF